MKNITIAVVLCLIVPGMYARAQGADSVSVKGEERAATLDVLNESLATALPGAVAEIVADTASVAEEMSPQASATCFCVVSYHDLSGKTSRSGVCLDLTGVVNKTYGGLAPQQESNRIDCNSRCTNAGAALNAAQRQAIANCACAAGVADGTRIRAYSAVGTKDYRTAHQVGVLVNRPEVKQTTCKCPPGWLSNTSNVDGGVTADGRCKKLVCKPIGVAPPPNGTQVGTWGFTWGNELWAYGTVANKGAAICTTVVLSPKVCKIQ